MGQLCTLVVVFFFLLVGLGLLITSLLTDSWYRVTTSSNVGPEFKSLYNYNFGLWRLCYDNIPRDIILDPSQSKEGSCIFIHKALIEKDETSADRDIQVRLHLSRTVVGCSIAAATCLLASLLTLLCGLWQDRGCSSLRESTLYLVTSILMLIAAISGIVSGTCFIAVRDLDNTTYRTVPVTPPAVPEFADQRYDWSFMLHWIGTGMAFLDSFLLLCLVKNSYDVVDEDSKLSRYINM